MDSKGRLSFCSKRIMQHVVLCTAVAAVSFFGAQAQTSKTTNCSAPSVYEGEPATITCDFGGPLNPSLTTLSVDFHGADGNQESIVNCFPDEANTSKCYYNKDWLRLRNDTIVTNPLIVDIPHATRNQSGVFSCHFAPKSGDEFSCVLDVKERFSQSTTQHQKLSDATRQTDEATRTTAGGLQNTTKPTTFGDEMPWSGDNDVASTDAGTIAAAVVASLAVLVVLIIGVVAYNRCRRESVRPCCRRAASKPPESRTEEGGVHANGTHVLPRDGGDETETCHVGAVDHPGADRNGSVCHNGDVNTPMLKKVDSCEDFEIVDKLELV